MLVRTGMIAGLLSLCMLLTGCGAGGSVPKEKRKMTPVTGIVKVDGKPEKGISVSCFRADQVVDKPVPSDFSSESAGVTDTEGKFAITTSAPNDGVPAGNYVLIFRKLTMSRMGTKKQKLSSPEKSFNDKYGNTAKSTVKLTVEEDKPMDVGVIELKSK